MTATNSPQYWILRTIYHESFNPTVYDNTLTISTASPFHRNEVHLHNCNGFDFDQYGPFATIEEARAAARQHFDGTWRQVEAPYRTPIFNTDSDARNVVETYVRNEHRPICISIDNGNNFLTADELFENEEFLANESCYWTQLVALMDDDYREQVANELAPCTNLEFLRRYCEIADYSICIG